MSTRVTHCVCFVRLRPHGFVPLPSSCPTVRRIYASGHGSSTHASVCSMARILQGMYARDRLLPSPDGGLARFNYMRLYTPRMIMSSTTTTFSGEAMISLGVRTLAYDYGRFTIEEFDGASVWPDGDPVVRDVETLVIFLERTNYEVEDERS